MNKLEEGNGYAQFRSKQDAVGLILLIHGIWCEYNNNHQDTYVMMQAKKCMKLLWKLKAQSSDEYNRLFESLIDVVEMYGVTSDEPILVLHQLVTNGVVVGANGDGIEEANPAHIVAAKTTLEESIKTATLLDGLNVQKYNNRKDGLENNFSEVTDN